MQRLPTLLFRQRQDCKSTEQTPEERKAAETGPPYICSSRRLWLFHRGRYFCPHPIVTKEIATVHLWNGFQCSQQWLSIFWNGTQWGTKAHWIVVTNTQRSWTELFCIIDGIFCHGMAFAHNMAVPYGHAVHLQHGSFRIALVDVDIWALGMSYALEASAAWVFLRNVL